MTAVRATTSRGHDLEQRDRFTPTELLIVAIPAVAIAASAPSVIARFVPAVGPPLESAGRYLPVLLAIPLLLRSPISRIRFTLPMVTWTLAGIVSSLVAVHPAGWGYSGAGAMLALYVGPWLLAGVELSGASAHRLLTSFSMAPVVLLTFAALAQGAGIAPLLEVDGASGSLRLGGLMIAAAWATLGVVGALASGMRIALGHKVGWALLGVSGLLVVLAQGRGAALALIAGSIPVVHLATRRHLRWRPARYVLRALALVALALLATAAGWKVVSDRQEVLPVPVYLSDVVNQSDPTSGRGEAWSYFLDRWTEQPVFGHGPSSTYVFSQSAESELIRHHFKAAHNEYVQALVEFGVFGLVLIAGGLLAEASICRRRAVAALRPFPASILAAFVVFALTDNATSPIFAVSIAMLLTVSRSITGPTDARPRPVRWLTPSDLADRRPTTTGANS